MEPNHVEFADSLKPLVEEGTISQEQADELLNKHVDLNKNLYARATSAEAEAKTLKEKAAIPSTTSTPPNLPPTPAEPDYKADVEMLKTAELKRQFGHKHSLSPEETDNLFGFAAGLKLKPEEALEHPFFKGGLASARNQNVIDSATPGPSSRSPIVEGKSFGDMTPEERKKNFSKVVDATRKR